MSYNNNFNNQQGNQYGNQQGSSGYGNNNQGQADENFNINVNFTQAQQVDINSQSIKAGTYTFTITDIKQRTSQKGTIFLNLTCENKDGQKVFHSVFPEQTDKFFSFVQMINPNIDARSLQSVNKTHFIGKLFNGTVALESYVHEGNERTKGVIRKIEQFQGQQVYAVSEVQTVTPQANRQQQNNFAGGQFGKQQNEHYYRYPQSATHDQVQQMNAQRAQQQYQQPQIGQFQQPEQTINVSDDDLPF